MLKYENEYFGRIRIDESGEISGETAWLVTVSGENASGAEAVRAAVQMWAGLPGDPLKVPTADGRSCTESNLYNVTRIELEPVGHQRCRVTFTYRSAYPLPAPGSGSDSGSASESSASGSVVSPVVTSVTESRAADGSLRRKALWRQAASTAL